MNSAVERATVVVVAYNSAYTLERCLASVPVEAELILIDNASTDGSGALATRVRPDAQIILAPSNGGFGAGCNLGLASARREVIVFLNPDAQFSSHSLALLIEAAELPQAGLIGPALVGEDGEPQLACRRWSTLARGFGESLPSWSKWAPSNMHPALPLTADVYSRGGPIAFSYGACMAMTRRSLLDIGGFDEDLFLYGEEEGLALRFRSRGLVSLYVPGAVVVHAGATSTKQIGDHAVYHLKRSQVVLHRKKTSQRWAAAVVLGSGAVISLAVTLVNLATGRRPPGKFKHDVAALRGIVAGAAARLRSSPDYPG